MFQVYVTKNQQPHGGIVNCYWLPSRAEINGTGYYRYSLLVTRDSHAKLLHGNHFSQHPCYTSKATSSVEFPGSRSPWQAAGHPNPSAALHSLSSPAHEPPGLRCFCWHPAPSSCPSGGCLWPTPLLPTAQSACDLLSGPIAGNFLHLGLINWLCALLCQEDGGSLRLWRQKLPLFEDVTTVIFLFSLCFKLRWCYHCFITLSGLKAYEASGFPCPFFSCLLIHIESKLSFQETRVHFML